MNSVPTEPGKGQHLWLLVATILFPPATILTVLIYILMRWSQCPRMTSMLVSVGTGMVVAVGQIVLMAGALITGHPIF
jgi:hypothetical protein